MILRIPLRYIIVLKKKSKTKFHPSFFRLGVWSDCVALGHSVSRELALSVLTEDIDDEWATATGGRVSFVNYKTLLGWKAE
jgi:hypothetical protein